MKWLSGYRGLVQRLDNLTLIPRIYTMKGENWLMHPLTSICECTVVSRAYIWDINTTSTIQQQQRQNSTLKMDREAKSGIGVHVCDLDRKWWQENKKLKVTPRFTVNSKPSLAMRSLFPKRKKEKKNPKWPLLQRTYENSQCAHKDV